MDTKDLLRAGAIVAGVAAVAAIGFAAGYIIARDPRALRRVARSAAGGLERIQIALAETREEIADLWAEVQSEARQDVEEHAFALAEGAIVEATMEQDAPVATPARPPRRRRTAADRTGASRARPATR
jgi:hypothetical protein